MGMGHVEESLLDWTPPSFGINMYRETLSHMKAKGARMEAWKNPSASMILPFHVKQESIQNKRELVRCQQLDPINF